MPEAKNRVSIWIGNATTNEALQKYMYVGYSQDGESRPSRFEKMFQTGDYEDDFREAWRLREPTDDFAKALKGCSFSEKVIPKVIALAGPRAPAPFNAVIMLYEFEYTGSRIEAKGVAVTMRFVGSITLE